MVVYPKAEERQQLAFSVTYKGVAYELKQIGIGADDRRDGYWHGYLKLECYTAIDNNQDFKDMLEVMVQQGFGDRIVGNRSISRMDAFEVEFTQSRTGATSLIKVGYATVRDKPQGEVIQEGDHFEIRNLREEIDDGR